MPLPTRVPLHVEVSDLADLAAIVEAVERLGHRVECPAFDGRERLRERDEHLRQAVGLMSAGSTWGKCRQLAVEIGKFEERWGRWRDCETVPESFGTLGRCLFQAKRLASLPSSAQQLVNIMAKSKGPCNLVEEPVSSAPNPE